MRARSALVLVLLGVLLAAPAVASHGGGGTATPATETDSPESRPNPCVGTITERPSTDTLVSIQGTRVHEGDYVKTKALLVQYGQNGSFEWAHNATANGKWWAYDVDRTADGDLLFATTRGGSSVIGVIDARTGAYEWRRHFDGNGITKVKDAHDADFLRDDAIVIADKGTGHERLLTYNLTQDRVTWEWRFDEHPDAFPRSGGGPYDTDWTHVNDVEVVGEHLVMASVRNFDTVVFVNRTSDEIAMGLGADDAHDVLFEQHNPDYLRGPDGEHTVLVADSLNDRVVEYRYDGSSGDWKRVWSAYGFDEPRDADRLENGNTLVTDRKGHRVVEITPAGEVVWEVYTPYEPYDAERGADESNGPTMRELNVSGQVAASGGAPFDERDVEACASALFRYASTDHGGLPAAGARGTPVSETPSAPHDLSRERVGPSTGPVATAATGVAGLSLLTLAVVALLAWRRD